MKGRIEAAFMVPHPPMIVPDIGKGSEKQVEKTIESYQIVAKQIAEIKPDTIISYSASPSMIACLLKCLGSAFNLIVSERSTTQTITNRVKLRFFLYRWASHVVPNSSSQEAFIKQHFPKLKDKVSVIHNYVDTGLFTPSSDELPCNDETKIISKSMALEGKIIIFRRGKKKYYIGMI